MLSTDVEQTGSVNTESTVNEKPKTKLFKRNYRGVTNKQSSAINSSGTTNSNNNISAAQTTQNEPICINSSKDADTAEVGEVSNETREQKDKFSHSVDDYYHNDTLPKTPNKSTCKHLLCYICCCNYCAFLSSSSQELKISWIVLSESFRFCTILSTVFCHNWSSPSSIFLPKVTTHLHPPNHVHDLPNKKVSNYINVQKENMFKNWAYVLIWIFLKTHKRIKTIVLNHY